jgi:hypothetical protein
MRFIKSKQKLGTHVDWIVSDHSKYIVKHYADYTGYSENEVVDMFLKNLLEDKDFVEWIKTKRRNKRTLTQLFPEME